MVAVYRWFEPVLGKSGEWVVWWVGGLTRLPEARDLAEHPDYAYFVW